MSPAAMDRLIKKVDSFIGEVLPVIDEAIKRQEALDLVPHLTRIVLRTAGIFVLNHDLVAESDELNSAFVDLNRLEYLSAWFTTPAPFIPESFR
jgi:hypothetical protein